MSYLNTMIIASVDTFNFTCIGVADVVQFGRAVTRRHCWPLGTQDVSIVANTEAGTIHAGFTIPACRHVTNDGQRSHVLRSSCPFHLHLQVSFYLSFTFIGTVRKCVLRSYVQIPLNLSGRWSVTRSEVSDKL